MTGHEGRSAPKVPGPEGGAFFVVFYSCDVSQHPQCVISGRTEVGKPGLKASAIRLAAIPSGPRDVRILPLVTLARVLVRSLTHEAGPIWRAADRGQPSLRSTAVASDRPAGSAAGDRDRPRPPGTPPAGTSTCAASSGSRPGTHRAGQRGAVAGGAGCRRPLLPDPSAAARAYPPPRHHGMRVRGSRRVDSEVWRLTGRHTGHCFSRHSSRED